MEPRIVFLRQRTVLFVASMMVLCLFTANADWQYGKGDIEYDLTGDTYVWDVSGTYSDSSTEFNINYVISQDAGGKITGTGAANAYVSGYRINLTFDVKGTVGTKKEAAWVKMTLKGKGKFLYYGESIKFSFTESVNAKIDPQSRTMTGTVKVKVSAMGYSESETVSFDESLPRDMNGSAVLSLNCASSGKKILGTGEIMLSNGDVYDFIASCKYNTKKDESALTLKGVGIDKKNNIKLKIDESDFSIASMTGKILGQKILIQSGN